VYTPGRADKKTKTIIRVYMCDTGGVYRRPYTTKIIAKILSVGIFVVPASANAGRGNYKDKKKDNFPQFTGDHFLIFCYL